MDYSITIEGKTYSLPKYSMQIAEKIEGQNLLNGGNQKYRDRCRSMYNLCSELLSKESVIELMGEFKDIDPNILNIIYLEIVNQYQTPLNDYQSDQTQDQLKKYDIDKLIEVVKTTEKMNTK